MDADTIAKLNEIDITINGLPLDGNIDPEELRSIQNQRRQLDELIRNRNMERKRNEENFQRRVDSKINDIRRNIDRHRRD